MGRSLQEGHRICIRCRSISRFSMMSFSALIKGLTGTNKSVAGTIVRGEVRCFSSTRMLLVALVLLNVAAAIQSTQAQLDIHLQQQLEDAQGLETISNQLDNASLKSSLDHDAPAFPNSATGKKDEASSLLSPDQSDSAASVSGDVPGAMQLTASTAETFESPDSQTNDADELTTSPTEATAAAVSTDIDTIETTTALPELEGVAVSTEERAQNEEAKVEEARTQVGYALQMHSRRDALHGKNMGLSNFKLLKLVHSNQLYLAFSSRSCSQSTPQSKSGRPFHSSRGQDHSLKFSG
jgi:hypothetical protein